MFLFFYPHMPCFYFIHRFGYLRSFKQLTLTSSLDYRLYKSPKGFSLSLTYRAFIHTGTANQILKSADNLWDLTNHRDFPMRCKSFPFNHKKKTIYFLLIMSQLLSFAHPSTLSLNKKAAKLTPPQALCRSQTANDLWAVRFNPSWNSSFRSFAFYCATFSSLSSCQYIHWNSLKTSRTLPQEGCLKRV